ncbi:MAG: hypothetical protein PHR68_04275 [Candidatus Gracilibacteria bacterium]|nr:hypothetical protein [Candidatus Gracilibacteria bacterium]
MISYLLKILALILTSFAVIFTYYGKDFSFHNESFSGYALYIVFMLISYSIYKFFQIFLTEDKVRFSPFSIFLYFILHLFLLNIVFFSVSNQALGYSMILFFKIIFYSIIPIFHILMSYSAGKKILNYFSSFSSETTTFKFLSSLGLGFSVFLTMLTILGSLGFYNLYSVLFIVLLFVGLSFKELKDTFASIFSYKIEFEKHETESEDIFKQINFYLLSSEFLFIVLTFLLSVNLINIVRPMPIGWDDLGVYMNYPQMMALSGDIKGFGMVAWQTFTGIGFMIHSNVQAFFLNNVGGILSSIVMVLAVGDLLKNTKKTFINIPLLVATMIMSMPMVIFQQAKDMKLDTGLLFMSVIAMYMIYYIFLKYIGHTEEISIKNKNGKISEKISTINGKETIEIKVEEKNESKFSLFSYKFNSFGKKDLFENKSYLFYIFVIGIIAGIAFAIKFTTLMLVIAFVGIIFFAKLGFSGFLGYFAIFLAIFTKANLWSYMNVVYPKDNISLINNFSYIALFVGILLLVYSVFKYKIEAFKKTLILLVIFSVGFITSILPWVAKNIYESAPNITISSLLFGKGASFNLDYTKIYTKEKIADIEKKYSSALSINSSGTTENEDMGRYLGYDKGVNNFLKMPYNLTMQTNQRGEFTDITFLYLALLPVILLFLAFRFNFLAIGIIGLLGLEYSLFSNKLGITEFLAGFELPEAYLPIFLSFLLPTIYFIYGLKNDKKSQLFRLNMIFAFVYIFLWTIAAFGIVWYGIPLYFSLILMIAIGLDYLSSYFDNDSDKEKIIKLFGSIISLGIISVYFFNSSFPHGFTNLQSASYISFKAGQVSQVIGIFDSHPDYFKILFELNIKDEMKAKVISDVKSMATDPNLIKILEKITTAEDLDNLLREIQTQNISGADALTMQNLRQESNKLREALYDATLYPTKETKNKEGIYRIGTFLKYFISENQSRFLDDSLVTEFHKYIYDENPDIAVEKIKKLGAKYFLTDLNAATIDKDPRHDLTKRFEELLFTYTSPNLELISTDSICLNIALDDYKKSDKSEAAKKQYMTIAGVNYESYEKQTDGTEKTILRGEKQLMCYNYILQLLQENKISETNYSYLVPIKNYLSQNKITDQTQLLNIFQQYITHGWLAVFKVK